MDVKERAALSINTADSELQIVGSDWIRWIDMVDLQNMIKEEVACHVERHGRGLPGWLQDAIEDGRIEGEERYDQETAHRAWVASYRPQ